jgi:preprotein translocase subunit SecF
VAIQFKSFKFGISAVLAMIHDSLVTVGMYSLFGHFFGAQVDLLFVTALLTILSFSVHDTIIVYDRIRESKKNYGESLYDLANKATSQTMVRSLNNTFVLVFMMVALLLLGGETIRWFVATLLVGSISGAYSSPFVAVSILVTWDEIQKKFKKH